MKYILCFLLFVLSYVAFPQERDAFNVKKADNKFIYKDNTIKIFAGQRISISAANKEGSLKGLKLTDTTASHIQGIKDLTENEKPGKDITIDFNVIKMSDTQYLSVLIVTNPYGRKLVYSALAYYSDRKEYLENSIRPVKSSGAGLETWPHPISEILLYDFQIQE